MKQVALNYVKSAGWVVAVFILAMLAARLASRKAQRLCRGRLRVVTFLLGSGFLFVAGIGRLGWQIQTWTSASQVETFDQNVFLTLSLLGTFLVAFEYLAGRFAENDKNDSAC